MFLALCESIARHSRGATVAVRLQSRSREAHGSDQFALFSMVSHATDAAALRVGLPSPAKPVLKTVMGTLRVAFPW